MRDGKNAILGIGRDRVRGLYPIIEGPTKTIQMPEMAIKRIKCYEPITKITQKLQNKYSTT